MMQIGPGKTFVFFTLKHPSVSYVIDLHISTEGANDAFDSYLHIISTFFVETSFKRMRFVLVRNVRHRVLMKTN
jgi:hypothetical protein